MNPKVLTDIKEELKRGIEYSTNIEAEFIKDFKNHPAHALSWSNKVFYAVAIRKEYTLILNALNQGCDLKEIMERKKEDILSRCSSVTNKSTSQTRNLMDDNEIEAIARFLQLVKYHV